MRVRDLDASSFTPLARPRQRKCIDDHGYATEATPRRPSVIASLRGHYQVVFRQIKDDEISDGLSVVFRVLDGLMYSISNAAQAVLRYTAIQLDFADEAVGRLQTTYDIGPSRRGGRLREWVRDSVVKQELSQISFVDRFALRGVPVYRK